MTESGNEETLFARALELPEAERRAFLDQVCGGDARLRLSIEALLRAHGVADDYLPKMVGEGRPLPRDATPIEEQPGDCIGRYKLLQQIGEGGCGIVYMAEQEEPVRRRVALKVIKLGMDTKAVVARFDAERQALAMMDHANIAKVFDAGSTNSGRPYFVMELVRGVPVTKYCDENGLSTEKRLELFTRICLAIQHAHQKGIIHRDIKPSNILVVLHDGTPVPKVIDFGIAKATQGKLTDQTLFTAFEQFIGTPAYMSPEQAEMSGLDIDTRSDVYSLGVLLYELLAGRPPFDPKTFATAGLDEMRRVIREVDPPKPSIRLSTLTAADQTTVAKLRGTAPTQLSLVLKGDLDWIVMRCLEKDRTRRYTTPSELIADIQRYLCNEPVIARPPSTGYLLRKLIRRHKVGFATGTAVAISLIAGLVASSVLLVRERSARERAVTAEVREGRLRRDAEQAGARELRLRTEADANASRARVAATKSAQVAEFMTDMLKGVGPSVALGRDPALLRDILDATARRLDSELNNQPEVTAYLRDTLGTVYFDLGEYESAERLLRTAISQRRVVYGSESAETAESLHNLGRALRHDTKLPEAKVVLEEALAIRRKLFGEEHPLIADTLIELAWANRTPQHMTEARAIVSEALAMRQKIFGEEHPQVAAALLNLGRIWQYDGNHEHAAPILEKALAMHRRFLNQRDPDLAAAIDALGFSCAHELDLQPKATVLFRESLGIRRSVQGVKHPDTLVSLLHFAGQRRARDISPDDVGLVRDFVAAQRKELPPDSPLLGPSLLALAALEDLPERDPETARALVREGRSILGSALAAGRTFDRDVVEAMMFFGWSKFYANAPREGLIMAEEALALVRVSGDPGTRVRSLHTLGWIALAEGRSDDAAKFFETALPALRASAGEDFPMTLADTAALGTCYCRLNRVGDAHRLLAAAVDSLETKTRKSRPDSHIAFVQGEYGLVLVRERRFAEAEVVLRKALDEYEHNEMRLLALRLRPPARALSGLGQALAGQGKFVEAEPLVVHAFQELQVNEHGFVGHSPGMVREALDAVIALYTAWAAVDPSKQPVAETWKKTLEEFEAKQTKPADVLAGKT